MGCDAGYLQPGDLVGAANGMRITVIRKVDLQAAVETAERIGDRSFVPVPGEHFYEVEVQRFAAVADN
jgi:hypothetical protein